MSQVVEPIIGPVVDGPPAETRPVRAPAGASPDHPARRPPVGVAVAGRGVPLVVVHGFSAEGFLYAQTLSRLVSMGFKVIAIDTAGHGGTAGPARRRSGPRRLRRAARPGHRRARHPAVHPGRPLDGRTAGHPARRRTTRPHDRRAPDRRDRRRHLGPDGLPVPARAAAAAPSSARRWWSTPPASLPVFRDPAQALKLMRLGRARPSPATSCSPWRLVGPMISILRSRSSRYALDELGRRGRRRSFAIHGDRDLPCRSAPPRRPRTAPTARSSVIERAGHSLDAPGPRDAAGDHGRAAGREGLGRPLPGPAAGRRPQDEEAPTVDGHREGLLRRAARGSSGSRPRRLDPSGRRARTAIPATSWTMSDAPTPTASPLPPERRPAEAAACPGFPGRVSRQLSSSARPAVWLLHDGSSSVWRPGPMPTGDTTCRSRPPTCPPRPTRSRSTAEARHRHGLARGADRAAHRSHQPPDRAPQGPQEGPPLPPRPADAGRQASPLPRLPREQRRRALPAAHRRARPRVAEPDPPDRLDHPRSGLVASPDRAVATPPASQRVVSCRVGRRRRSRAGAPEPVRRSTTGNWPSCSHTRGPTARRAKGECTHG